MQQAFQRKKMEELRKIEEYNRKMETIEKQKIQMEIEHDNKLKEKNMQIRKKEEKVNEIKMSKIEQNRNKISQIIEKFNLTEDRVRERQKSLEREQVLTRVSSNMKRFEKDVTLKRIHNKNKFMLKTGLKNNLKSEKIESEEESEEEDPETLARIKQLERGRQGFNPVELGRVKYHDDLEEVKYIAVPFNNKLDVVENNQPKPQQMYGPRSTDCLCCDMQIHKGVKFLFLKCCRTVYH